MKLARVLTVVGLGLSSVGGLFALQACSSSSDSSAGGGATGAVPPVLPSGAAATTSTTEHNFALHTLLLGDTARGSSSPSGSAWKDFGYNIDGKLSTPSSTDLCTVAAGAKKSSVYQDGNNGIDNSFGENILPIILSVAGGDAASKINKSISDGAFTIQIDVTGLSDEATQTASGLSGFLNAGGAFDDTDGGTAVPTFTSADNWPVLTTLLTDPTNPKSSKIKFPGAYVVNGTFVNGPFGSASNDITISISLSGVSLALTVHKAILTFDHKTATSASNGTIAGVIKTSELISGLHSVAGSLSTSLCTGSAFDDIAAQISAASDIISDGTNVAGTPCDGISIGLGFTADQIAVATKTHDPSSGGALDKCATDGGTTGDAGQ
ncbi:MAG: hypothetical protein ABI461_22735 [Polyangiaceae bacterium]